MITIHLLRIVSLYKPIGYVQGEDLVIANLGDSRAVLGTVAENGIMPVQLTTDLKPNVPCKYQ